MNRRFKIIEKYRAEVQAAVSAADPYTRGQTVPWSVLEAAMGRKRTDTGGWQIIRRLRKRLLRDREIVTLPDPNTGLRLLTDQQAATEIPVLRQKKAYRQFGRGIREIGAIRRASLSDHEQKVLAFQERAMREERRATGKAKRAAEKGVSRTECLPVRK